jgi:hypothetical protein
VRPFRNALILKFRPQKLNHIKIKPEDTNTPQPDQSSLDRVALLRNWVGGAQSPSKDDRFIVRQMPAKPWTPGPEDFQLLQEMFSQRDPRPRKR